MLGLSFDTKSNRFLIRNVFECQNIIYLFMYNGFRFAQHKNELKFYIGCLLQSFSFVFLNYYLSEIIFLV